MILLIVKKLAQFLLQTKIDKPKSNGNNSFEENLYRKNYFFGDSRNVKIKNYSEKIDIDNRIEQAVKQFKTDQYGYAYIDEIKYQMIMNGEIITDEIEQYLFSNMNFLGLVNCYDFIRHLIDAEY